MIGPYLKVDDGKSGKVAPHGNHNAPGHSHGEDGKGHGGHGGNKYSKKARFFLNFITAIAVGVLIGDALIHIIPHSFETAAALSAEAKGEVDPHAGHGHRFRRFLPVEATTNTLADHTRQLEEDAVEEEAHDHSAGIRVGIWVCAGIFG